MQYGKIYSEYLLPSLFTLNILNMNHVGLEMFNQKFWGLKILSE